MGSLPTRERLAQHILGSLAVTAIGDAMGAATEQHAIPEIVELFGGPLRELRDPSPETFSYGNRAGQITDDSSQMFVLAQVLIAADGEFRDQDWIAALLHWSQYSPHRHQMGPTTRPLLQALANGEDTTKIGRGLSARKLTSFGATNGAAMRIAPAGLVYPGDVERAVELAWQTSRLTHDTQIAAAGAGAIAAGVAHALMPGANVYSVVQACLEGARLGEAIGIREGRRIPGPSVARRIELAVEEAIRATSPLDALMRIEASVGNSVMTVESVPAAVGAFVVGAGVPLDVVSAGATLGNDSDTIAAMAGSLAGAMQGMAAVPEDLFATVKAVNDEDIEAIAEGLTRIAWQRLSAA